MSSVLRFLEAMGRSAELHRAAKPALYKALSEHSFDQAIQWAILRGDSGRLQALLGVNPDMFCHLFATQVDGYEADAQEVSEVA